MSQYVFGVDIGGTSVKLGLFDVKGILLDKWEIPTRTQEGGSHILPDIAESIRNKIDEKQIDTELIAGVGVGAPGPIDNAGVVHKAVNLGWDTFSIKVTLEELLQMPVMAGNDANVAALGEMWKGGGQGSNDLILVTLGTGVGGGLIVGGRVLTGSAGAGGEIGHIHVEDNETECCNCGNKGCLEQYASATGITRLANRKLKEGRAEEFGRYLGNALAVIAGVVNPDAIVIGGGVSKAGEVLMDYIRPYYEKNVFHGSRDVKFSLATLGNDAGIYGAAKLVLDI